MPRANRASDVVQHRRRGETSLGPAGRRDDAVRAEERAAVLDLDEGARPLDRRATIVDALDLDSGQRRQRAPDHRLAPAVSCQPAVPDEPLELRGKPVLVAVVDETSHRIGFLESLPADLDRAAGDDDLGARVRPTCPTDGMARLGVRLRRDRAGVDDDEVGRAGATDEADVVLPEASGGRLHLGLVDLAAEVDDRRRPDRSGDAGAMGRLRHSAHHRRGFVLIRKPIVPTRPAIA